MISLQSNNNVLLSAFIAGGIVAIIAVIYFLIRQRNVLKEISAVVKGMLGGSLGIILFTIIRIAIGVIGVGVFIATIVPGYMPFSGYENQNLGLGGMVFFLLWPIIMTQIAVAFVPYSRKWLSNNALFAWIILLLVGYVLLSIDIAAINISYDFTRRIN
jgi:hypothetical protein